jgi:hypothetical protein
MSSKPTPTTPIPIGRKRSGSESSIDSNVPALSPGSTASQSPPQSPVLPSKAIPSSPILSYFFNKDGAPKSPNAMRPSLPTLPTASLEKDASIPKPPLSPVLGHHRAMSMSSGWPKFPTSNAPVVKDAHERGAGIFRRLSISGASPFQRPTNPSNERTDREQDNMNALYRAQTVSGNTNTLPRSRPHQRRATLSPGDTPRPRAPSPIGERMLKGHFDGFV